MNKAKRISVLLAAVCLMLSACGQHPVLSEQSEQTTAPAQSETTQPIETARPETALTEAEETTQPTIAQTEPVLPETEPSEETFVRMTDFLPDIVVELKYATGDNFTGKVIYPFDTCYLRYGTVKKLMAVQESLRERGLGLKIWDGFRPVSAQFALWEACPDPTYVANPETGYSSHSRGNTVDLTLVDADGKELTMPTGFDSFSSLADRDYSDCPEEARENALLLQNIMEEKGFTGYFGEWWHFSDTVKYDVERVFDPALVAPRYARCEEFISLRTEPDTSAEVITRIPVGGEFTLLGYTGDFSMVEYRGQVGYVLTSYTSATPVEQSAPDLWTPNCEEYITLRKSKGGETLTRIPLGEEFVLLGWEEAYALVEYRGQQGYVLTSYIQPSRENWFYECLDTVVPTAVYSCEQLMKDAQALEKANPDKVNLDAIGTSELGRMIPVLRIGDPEAAHQVLVQGAIHGREHMTAWLLMAMADYWMENGLRETPDVCFHVIPMVNPDGVTLSQSGQLDEDQQSIYERDLQNGYTGDGAADYAALWKANGVGVDLNRNFPAGWELAVERTGPSAMLFRGEEPFSAAETKALRDYTLAYAFDATVSYHASGCVIYWEYGTRQPVNDRALSLAKQLQTVTGYLPQGSEGIDGAGYKDWVMEELGIPSVTVEIGASMAPLAERELYATFARNRDVFSAVAQWLE